jgi:tripartite-type tricarboxylate transporter receptor subunit TctC
MFLPKKAAPAVVEALQKDIARIVHEPELKQLIVSGGTEPLANTPDEFSALLAREIPRWTRVARDAQIKPD